MAGQPIPRKHPPSPNGAPTLTLLGHYAGRPDIAISRQVTVIGSRPGSRLHLASSTVSQSHALIINSTVGPYVRDLASRTHVYINGKDHREADLSDGDLLQIGKFKFQFNAGIPGAGVEIGRDVRDPAPEALLNVEGGEMPLPIETRSVLIGRRPTCDIPLMEDSVSTVHAILFEMNGRRFIRDLGSRTGTFVNGSRINGQVELKFGDQIRIGETTIGYAGATGEVADPGEADELDHLVSTAPLGTNAFEPQSLDRDEKQHGKQQSAIEPDDAIPMIEDESAPDEPAVASSGSVAEPEPPPADQVQLDSDPDVAGPGETAVLAAQAEKPRKAPTLRTPPVEESQDAEPGAPVETDAAFMDEPAAPASASAEDAVVDDVLGLTPESREREAAKVDDLSGSRRGWRGMQVDESTLPAADRPAVVDGRQQIEMAPSAEDIVSSATLKAEEEPALDATESFAEAPAIEAPIGADDDTLAPVDTLPVDTFPIDTLPVDTLPVDTLPVDTLPVDTLDIPMEAPAPLAADEPDAAAIEDELHLPPVIDDVVVDDAEIEPLPLTPEEGAPLDLSVDEAPAVVDDPAPALALSDPEPEAPVPAAPPIETMESADDAIPPATPHAEKPVLPPAPEPELIPEASEPVVEAPAPRPEPESEPIAEIPVPATEPEPAQKGKRKRGARVAKPRTPRKKKGAAEAPVEEPPAPAAAPAPVVAPAPLVVPRPAPEPVTEAPAPEPQPIADTPAPAPEAEPEPAPEPAPEAEPALESPSIEPVAEAPRDTVEIVEQTHPTPESALGEDAVADMLAEPLSVDGANDAPPANDLTDTSFGRAVDSFVGESSGPLVEAREQREEEVAGEEPEAGLEEAPVPEEAPAAPAPHEALAAGPSDDESKAIDDLVADVMGEAPASTDEAGAIDAEIEDLDFAIEEPVADAPEPVADAPEPLADAPEPLADAPEPLADAPKPVDAPLEPEPVARDNVSDRPPATEPPPGHERSASPASWGPNQEHFLGGMPLKLSKPVKQAGLAGNAGAAAARQGQPSMPPPPPRATRLNARTRSPWDAAPGGGPVEDLGASIPPFAGKSPKKGQITTGFDGLAMPPVRETDVFSQMGPAAFAAGLTPAADDDEDIFSRGARVARQKQQPAPAPQSPSPAPAEPPLDFDKRSRAEVSRVKTVPPAGQTLTIADDTVASATPQAEEDLAPDDGVWTDDASPADGSDEQQPVGAGAAPPRRNRPLPTPPAFPNSEAQPAPKRKRRWFGLRLLLIAMLFLAGGAAGGIYALVKKQTTVVGMLRFDNFPSKTIERQALLTEQRKIVADHAFRESARKVLAQRHPDLRPGFLAEPIAYDRAASQADWAGGQNGAFAFTYNGRDVQGDPHRVRAVMLALYEANTKNLGGAGELRTTLASLNNARETSERHVADLKGRIDRLSAIALQMPERKRIEELMNEANRLEKEYTAAARRVLELKADVERMQAAMPANPQPAGTAQAPVVDPELSKMQAELHAASAKLAAGKAARAKTAEAAQVALDAALESFQKQVAGAQTVARDNPELAAYLAGAQELQTSTRDLTEKLIRRQQEQQRRLAEMKTRLAEKFEAKRADTWKRDPELKELGDELAIAQRQVSAAENGGAPKPEVAELKSHVALLENMIQTRQVLVGDDQFYADAINQLQKFIDDTQRGIDADRNHTEAELQKMQAAFAKTQPSVEQMPEAQRELAASLARQLEEINAARRTYNVAADAVAGDEEMRKAEAAAAALAAQVDARRKELAAQAEKAATAEQEQNRLAALKDREAELGAAQARAAQAQQALVAAQKALRAAQATEAEARDAGERRDALQNERVTAQKELEAVLRQLDLKRSQASSSPEPLAPTETDVEMTVSDPRPTYALASVGGIVAVFTILMLVTGTGAGAQPDEVPPPLAELAPVVERTPPTPMPQAVNGNSAPAQSRQARPDDAQPRVAV